MIGMPVTSMWRKLTLSLLLALNLTGVVGANTTAQAWAVLASEGPSWTTPEQVSDAPDAASEAPALAVTESGVAHLVWEEDDRLYHAYRTGDVWTSPAPIPGVGAGEEPAVAAGPGDDVQLVYAKFEDVYDIYRVAWDGSECNWGPSRNVSQHETLSSHSPDVAVDALGDIHIVAMASTEQLYYTRVGDGSFGPIPNAGGQAPSVVVGRTPTITIRVAYRHSLISDIFVVEGSNGSWGLPGAVSDSDGFSTAPRLTLDGDGVPHVVWQEMINGVSQVQYAYAPAWTPVITLSASSTGTTLPALAIDAHGGVHVAWGDGTVPSYALLHRWRAKAGLWQAPRPVREANWPIDDLVLSAGADGSLHVAWVEGIPGEIWHASAKPMRLFLPLVLRS